MHSTFCCFSSVLKWTKKSQWNIDYIRAWLRLWSINIGYKKLGLFLPKRWPGSKTIFIFFEVEECLLVELCNRDLVHEPTSLHSSISKKDKIFYYTWSPLDKNYSNFVKQQPKSCYYIRAFDISIFDEGKLAVGAD